MAAFAALNLAPSAFAEETSALDPHGWPCWQGPFGAGFRDFGYELVKDKTKIKELWVSEEQEIPCGWIGAQGERNLGIAGGYGGPMAYRDRVYHAWVWPSGEAYDAPQAEKSLDKRPEKWRVSGDDIIVCMDAETGTNIWKIAFEGKGWPSQLSMHHALMMPVAWDGKIYLNGSGGRLYCADAATGKKLWESRLGAFTDAVDKYKAAGITHFGGKLKENKEKAEGVPSIRRGPLLSVAAVGDGVAVVSDERNFKGPPDGTPHGLTAFDALTGEKLWSTPFNCVGGISSPVVTKWRDQLSFVSYCSERAVGLDSKTGEVLWQITPEDRGGKYVGSDKTTPAAYDGYVIIQGKEYEELETPEGGKPKKVRKYVYPSCWKVDGEKPEMVWEMERPGGGPGRGGNPVIYRGRAYVPWVNLHCLDLKTGKELSVVERFAGILSGTVSDGIYAKQSAQVSVAEEAMLRLDQKGGGVRIAGGGFDHPCLYKGRLYVRKAIQAPPKAPKRAAKEGLEPSKWDPKYAVACYELRATPNATETAAQE